jgi:hypothetical protein
MYARMSAHGCPENREKFRLLALREIDIARALDSPHRLDPAPFLFVFKQLGMVGEIRAGLDQMAREGRCPEVIRSLRLLLF